MSDADYPDTKAKTRWIADRLTARAKDQTIHDWLESLGVLCDCDNGYITADVGKFGTSEILDECPRCVLVEVGGIRVRWLKDKLEVDGYQGPMGLLQLSPAVEVTG